MKAAYRSVRIYFYFLNAKTFKNLASQPTTTVQQMCQPIGLLQHDDHSPKQLKKRLLNRIASFFGKAKCKARPKNQMQNAIQLPHLLSTEWLMQMPGKKGAKICFITSGQ